MSEENSFPGIAPICRLCPYKDAFELSRILQKASIEMRSIQDQNTELVDKVKKLEEKLKRLESE